MATSAIVQETQNLATGLVFADDFKLFAVKISNEDCISIQHDLDYVQTCCNTNKNIFSTILNAIVRSTLEETNHHFYLITHLTQNLFMQSWLLKFGCHF